MSSRELLLLRKSAGVIQASYTWLALLEVDPRTLHWMEAWAKSQDTLKERYFPDSLGISWIETVAF